MNKAMKFRIYPNEEQKVQFEKTFGCCRFLYNKMLEDKIREYEKNKKMIFVTPAQYKGEYPWLKEIDSLALANVQLHLERAYKNFFKQPSCGFPKFKSKHRGSKSYTTNVVNGNIKVMQGSLKLPKLSPVKIKLHRLIPSMYKLKSVTISKEPSGKYYASLLYTYESQVSKEKSDIENAVGIDFAMKGMAVFSSGERGEYPMFYKKAEKKLAREQRRLSKCKRGSKNYYKQKKKVSLCHEKIRNQRKDFHHKLSTKIVNKYDVVSVENLHMRDMSGTLHLGKGVMDNGYGSFTQMLSYKLEDRGKILVKVDKYYPSSKICSSCGKIKDKLALSERTYSCTCGNRIDRDINAAINIREEGKRLLLAS